MFASETALFNFIIETFASYKNNFKILECFLAEDILCSSFEQRYILHNVSYKFQEIKRNAVKEDLIEYYLDSEDGSLYKIELFFTNIWLLKSFYFQCQGCFGEDEACGVCGGSGWGVL
jgi:hypothetical protein